MLMTSPHTACCAIVTGVAGGYVANSRRARAFVYQHDSVRRIRRAITDDRCPKHTVSATSRLLCLTQSTTIHWIFFAVVETRHDSAEATSVVAATPPSYLVFERTRPMSATKAASLAINHVDICVFARSDVQESVLDLPTYKSFELLPLNVRHGTMSFVLVVIYDQTPASSALSVNDEFLCGPPP